MENAWFNRGKPLLDRVPSLNSYGGSVVTEAGTDPSVVGLVYVAGHMPDAGESEHEDGTLFPSDLSKSTLIKTTADGFTFLDPTQFHDFFAADVPVEQAAFMSRTQVFNAAVNFEAVITTPAWRENRVGWSSPGPIELSAPNSNGFMLREPTARPSKSQAPATRLRLPSQGSCRCT
jgi:hypothetical protein